MSHKATAPIVVHRSDVDFYYMDFGPILKGRTISSVATPTASPSGPTIASEAVLSTETTVTLGENNSLVIEANTGIKFKISGQSANTEYTITAVATLSDGNTLALDGILKSV